MDPYTYGFLRDEAQYGENPEAAREELYSRSEYAAAGMNVQRTAVQEHERWQWHDTHECSEDKMVMDMSDCTTYTACTHCLERVWTHEANVKPLYFNRAA